MTATVFAAGCGSDDDEGKSDEDQIRDIVQVQEDAFNNADLDAFIATLCESNVAKAKDTLDQATFDAIRESGDSDAEVTKIEIDGTKATVTIDGHIGGDDSSESESTFVQEDGEWKDCTS